MKPKNNKGEEIHPPHKEIEPTYMRPEREIIGDQLITRNGNVVHSRQLSEFELEMIRNMRIIKIV